MPVVCARSLAHALLRRGRQRVLSTGRSSRDTVVSGEVENVSVHRSAEEAEERRAREQADPRTEELAPQVDTSHKHGDVYSSTPRSVSERPRSSFEIDTPGLAAVVHAKVPPGSGIRCVTNSLVGVSSGAEVTSVLAAGAAGTLRRVAAGGSAWFHEVRSSADAERHVDALIAPQSLGDVCVIRLDPEYPLHLRVGSVLAVTEGVELSTEVSSHPNLASGAGNPAGGPLPLSAGPLAHLKNMFARVAARSAQAAISIPHFGKTRMITVAGGRGDVAVTSFGAIFRVSLSSSQDKYSVNPEHVIGWHGSVREMGRGLDGKTSGVADKIKFWRGSGSIDGLVTVSGPGDLYLQTRGERKTRAQRMREERMEMEILEDDIEARRARKEN